MADIQIAVIDEKDTQIALAVPGIQGPAGAISSGGSANQVFYKVSGTNYDAGWTFIGNANVDAAAAIAGTKISPNFGSQATVTTGTNTAASFIPTSATIPSNGIYLPGANQVGVATNGTQRITIDSSGRFLVGTSSNDSNFDSKLQIAAGDATASSLLTRFSANSGGPVIYFGKSRSASVGTKSLVSDGDTLGGLEFYGSGAANWQLSAKIEAQVDGTPESGGDTSDMPGRLVFSTTADGGSSPSERLRITSAGLVGIGTTNPGIAGEGAGLVVRNYSERSQYYSPAGYYAGSIGYTNDTQTRVWLSVDSDYSQGSAVSAGIFLSSYHQDTGGGHCGYTIKDLRADGALVFSRVTTAASLGTAATETERARIDSSGRLLVGTASGTGDALLAVQGRQSDAARGGILQLRRGQAASALSAGDDIGAIRFSDNTSGNTGFAEILCASDGASGASDFPGRLVFSTTADGASSPTERMRITSAGYFCASSTGSFAATTRHNFTWNSSERFQLNHTSTTVTDNFGIEILYSATPNNTGQEFLRFADSTALRATMRSNGGLANFQANDVNLSDINTKKDISLAADTWDCVKKWEIVNYRYKDQPDDANLNVGVIAQQVAESCPEVITIFQEAEDATEDKPAQEERLGVREQQMYWMAIKALQEAMERIEQLETEMAAVKAQLA